MRGSQKSQPKQLLNDFPKDLHLVYGPEETVHSSRLRNFEVFRLSGGKGDIGYGMLANAYGQRFRPFLSIYGRLHLVAARIVATGALGIQLYSVHFGD